MTCEEARDIDADQAQDHGGILHAAVAADEGLEASERSDVCVAARVDRDARLDVDASLLGPGNDAFDTLAVVQHVDDGGMKQHLDVRFLAAKP